VIDDEKITTLVMTFANGNKIVAGSSNPKFFRSKGGAAGLDEFAFHRDGASCSRPRTRRRCSGATRCGSGHAQRPGLLLQPADPAAELGKLKASCTR
jgi:phage FluMu gp28-like protein